MEDERLLTVKQVAERFGVRLETVRRWISDGRLKAVMPGGTKVGYRIPASAVDRLLRGEPAPESPKSEVPRLLAVPDSEAPARVGSATAHRRTAAKLRGGGDEDAARFYEQQADEIEQMEQGG